MDSDGLPLGVSVTEASVQDRDGARDLLRAVHARFPELAKAYADSAYSGELVAWCKQELNINLEIVKRSDDCPSMAWVEPGQAVPPTTGFKVAKFRWVVERTLGWLAMFRRLSKDYEYTIASSKAWLMVALVWMMTRRLAAA